MEFIKVSMADVHLPTKELTSSSSSSATPLVLMDEETEQKTKEMKAMQESFEKAIEESKELDCFTTPLKKKRKLGGAKPPPPPPAGSGAKVQ
eukprot:5407012-Lingulodinium_polyedra.AAC.1